MQTVKGPLSLTEHFSEKFGKHIYIFGEMHYFTEDCKGEPISKFLYETIRDSDKFIDFYLESPNYTDYEYKRLFPSDYKENFQTISNIEYKFSNCFRRDKKDCELPNLRAHWTDIRRTEKIAKITQKLQLYLLFWKGDIRKNRSEEKDIEKVYNLFSEFYNQPVVKKSKDMPMFIDNISKLYSRLITKQLKSIDDSAIKNTLEDWFNFSCTENVFANERTIQFLNEYQGNLLYAPYYYLSILQKTIDSVEKIRILDLVSGFMNYITGSMACIMDIYLLSRVFRTFRDSVSPQNIIIYVGDHHAESYRQVLNMLDFTLIASSRTDDNKCLDISNFKQPFFT